ncbi:hypothetical protein GcM1_222075 [Golovinomyces cichoracearum]|uniref:Uncharacterized protein n=1 Tax=Golovinomyces cichoracearum TaxID=62708 RepID=A0A420IRI8_9PEZI|nr:hypothetical protein GcM1_222075 [Golovinomyces cichoracearum]
MGQNSREGLVLADERVMRLAKAKVAVRNDAALENSEENEDFLQKYDQTQRAMIILQVLRLKIIQMIQALRETKASWV